MSFFKKALGKVAPIAGKALGGFFGGPMGATIGGALGSAVGGSLSSSKQKKALRQASGAAAFNPWNVSGPGGSIGFDGNQMSMGFSPQQQGMFDALGLGAMGQFGGGANAAYQNFAGSMGGQMPGLWNQFYDASNNVPTDAFNQFQSQMGQMGGMAMDGAGQAFGQAFGPGQNAGQYDELFGQGMGLLGQNFDDVAAERTNLLRQQAQPFEDRAQNAMFQKMHSMGQMASTTGGRNMGEFGDALTRADLGRQLAGQDLGMNLLAQNRQTGMGMLGQALQGRGMNMQHQLGMGNLGMGMLGQAGQFAGMGLDGAVGMSDMINSRATQRLSEAQNMLFGGQNMQNQQYQNALAMLMQQQGMLQGLGNMGTLGANLGGMGANAGANQAQYLAQNNQSGLGSFLSNAGGQLFDKGMEHFLPKIFGGGATNEQGGAGGSVILEG